MALSMMVILREVWDTRDLVGQALDADGNVNAAQLAMRMESEDLNALEMALRIKDEHGGTVTAISIGAPREVDVLKEALYRGADGAVRIDADPQALDTQAAAALIAAAIGKQDACDLVLAGVTINDGQGSVLGAHVAALLGVEQASYVDDIAAVEDAAVVARRGIEMGYEDVRLPLPAVLTVGVALVEDDPRTPRSAKAMLKLKHKKTEVPALTPADLGVDPAAAARTAWVQREAIPERVIESREVDADDEGALAAMLDEIRKGD